jgi:hypothetical protein
MSNTLSPVRSPDPNRLSFPVPALPASGARPSLADRVSLRVGLWLLLRSTRSVRKNAAHDSHHLHVHNERARLAREQTASRNLLLWTVHA